MRNNHWEVTEAQNALKAYVATEDRGLIALAFRYLEKALECVQCMYCHEQLGFTWDVNKKEFVEKPYESHFKGYVHVECRQRYRGRLDYLRQHERMDSNSLSHST